MLSGSILKKIVSHGSSALLQLKFCTPLWAHTDRVRPSVPCQYIWFPSVSICGRAFGLDILIWMLMNDELMWYTHWWLPMCFEPCDLAECVSCPTWVAYVNLYISVTVGVLGHCRNSNILTVTSTCLICVQCDAVAAQLLIWLCVSCRQLCVVCAYSWSDCMSCQLSFN